MAKQRPSEIFLEVWQAITAIDSELPAENFARYADAWRQIVNLEEIYAEAEQRRMMKELLAHWDEDPQPIRALRSDEGVAPCAGEEKRSDSDRARPEGTAEDTKGPGGPSFAAQDDRPMPVTYDCASAPMPEPDEDPAADEAARRAAKAEAGRQGMITRKRNALERLDALRAAGVTMAEIAGQHAALTITDVMDAMDRKPLPLPKLAALEAAMGKIEAARRGEDCTSSAPPPRGRRKKGDG